MTLGIGNLAIALFANAFATGLILYLLITILGPLSGAHLNPAVTLLFVLSREVPVPLALGYVAAQAIGALMAVALTHVMFGLDVFQLAAMPRTGAALWLSEGVATFGLMFTICGGQRFAPAQVPALVGAWIAAAFWFTGSASFANPAVTLARAFSDTITGIRLTDAPAFMAAEFAAAIVAVWVLPKLFSR